MKTNFQLKLILPGTRNRSFETKKDTEEEEGAEEEGETGCEIKLREKFYAVWPEKNRQMSIKVAQKMISIDKLKILAPTQKLPKTVGDLCKLIVAKGFKNLPKVQ